jgi:hypothetical protein
MELCQLGGWVGRALFLFRVSRRGCFFVRVFFHHDHGLVGRRGVADRAVQ